MPRLSPVLLRRAVQQSPLLARLLRECRDLESATNELRWLREHALGGVQMQHQRREIDLDTSMTDNTAATTTTTTSASTAAVANVFSSTSFNQARHRLVSYVNRRSRGEPLQYILGNQPFGDLDILCRRNVLIPRPETEVYTTKVAEYLTEIRNAEARLEDRRSPLRIADLCTGTGCISLLLYSLLCPVINPQTSDSLSQTKTGVEHLSGIQIQGFDISPHALHLAHENLSHNIQLGTLQNAARQDVSFHYLDVLALTGEAAEHHPASSDFLAQNWDVIISNPPYISPSDFAPGGNTSRSVREYEPKLALIPLPIDPTNSEPDLVAIKTSLGDDIRQEDQFYYAILQVAHRMDTKLVVLEVGDAAQARRVRNMASKVLDDLEPPSIETWRDDASEMVDDRDGSTGRVFADTDLAHERAVVVWRGPFARWRRSKM